MQWNLHQGNKNHPIGERYALFYHITYANLTFQVMLGVTEEGKCQLLEHHWIDETAKSFAKKYCLLPYILEHYAKGIGLMEFPTESEVKTFVESRILEWVEQQTI
jgi:hypothetical protein